MSFDFPEPTDQTRGDKLQLWATFYHVHVAQAIAAGQPLLNAEGNDLGAFLSDKDWCMGALEGTVHVQTLTGELKTYNFVSRATTKQCDCTRFFRPEKKSVAEPLGYSRFEETKAPFGLGVQGMMLVPYRSIAVDSHVIPYRTVIYIPQARGYKITQPTGAQIVHDGYFYAADKGGGVKDHHIDVFGGMSSNNPFPDFIKSVPQETFEAFFINDAAIADKLKKEHTPHA